MALTVAISFQQLIDHLGYLSGQGHLGDFLAFYRSQAAVEV
jgi:hypothetical protein